MTHITDGEMARQAAFAEVWYVHGGERHWVPDGETVNSLGGWGSVQVVSDAIDNPIGDNWPSVIDGAKHYPDGNLLTAAPSPAVYVMENGARRWIPDPQTFDARGYDWAAVRHLSEPEINSIPLGQPLPSVVQPSSNLVSCNTGDVALGAGHFMHTWGHLTRDTGRCAVQTRTRTVTWFGGFHGGVSIVLCDANGDWVPGGRSGQQRFGVDGTVIGQSDRTDPWELSIAPADAARVVTATAFQTWKPDDFQVVLDKWVAAGKSVSDLASSATAIAKVVTSAFA